jgi:hypothetical protein
MSKRDAEGKTDDEAGKKQKTGKSKPTCLRCSPSRAARAVVGAACADGGCFLVGFARCTAFVWQGTAGVGAGRRRGTRW